MAELNGLTINGSNYTFEDDVARGLAATEKNRAQEAEQSLQTAINNKVDKVTGKGLSTNDYTNEEKAKLAGLNNYDDTQVRQLINEEKAARQQGDNALRESITQEETRAKGVEQTLQLAIDVINGKIPAQATAQNQLADKEFVNSSISTATADFKGTYNSLQELEQVTANANDYAFVIATDAVGNTVYKRYKWVEGTGWSFEYDLNNSSFTAAQWAAIQSGITAALVTKLTDLPTNAEMNQRISTAITTALGQYYTKSEIDEALGGKQNTIDGLANIRSGAQAGSTAVQPSMLNNVVKNTVAESGVYDVSANNDNTKFESLSALLSSANLNTLIPTDIRKGGMSIKFVQTTPAKYTVVKTEGVETQPTGTEVQEALSLESGTYTAAQMIGVTPPASGGATYYIAVTVDETTTYTTWVITKVTNDVQKYVQRYYMETDATTAATFTNVVNWQGVDDEPTAESDNLVKSGSVYDIQKDLEYTNDAINRKKSILPNGSAKSYLPTTTTIVPGSIYRAYDYNVEDINSIIKIHSNYLIPQRVYETVVLWALYDTTPTTNTQPIAYGPLLSSGEHISECDLSLYPNKKVLKVTFHVTTPDTEVGYYTTDFVTADEVNDVLRTTDVVDNLESTEVDKPLSAKQGKALHDRLITQETLTSTGSAKNNIPTNTGVRISGGGYYSALVYDVTGKSHLAYSTDATITASYSTAVTWALYSSDTIFNETTVVAVGNLLSEGIFSGSIDLSLYPTATVLLVTCKKATAVVTVTNSVEKYATKQEVNESINSLDDRVDELETDSQIVSVVLPNKIHAVKGDRLQVFYRGAIACLNPSIYNVKALCDVGKAYPRYFHYEALSANVGTSKDLQLLVEGSNGVVKSQGTVPIMTINTPSSPASNKNVLVFGASVFGSGSITNELRRRLTETSGTIGDRSNPKGLGLSNITFVGRKRGSSYDVPQEATGGWGWSEYATQGRLAYRFTVSSVVQLHIGDVYSDGSHSYTVAEINVTDGSGNIRCLGSAAPISTSGTLSLSKGSGDATITYSAYTAESYSPFYNSETHQIDFINYANTYCNGSIDIMVTLCGTNDIFGGNIENVATTYNSYIKPFIRKYHEQFPNGKFILSTLYLPDMNGGLGASYGAGQTANWWNQAQKNYEFARLAYELEADSEFSSYVTVANVMHLFDTENLYIYGNVPVCNRLPDVSERLGQNGVHPSGSGGSFDIGDNEAGTKTIADALYYAVCANL